MSMSIDQIFYDKFKEIQSRIPLKMNTPSDNNVDFQSILDKASTSSTSNNSSSKSQWMPEIEKAITTSSNKYDLDPNLVKAIVKAESGFNPKAVSKAGAQGLMQLMPSTAKSLGVTNSFDISQNIEGGVKYIKEKIAQFNGDIKLGLAAYNAGPNNVTKYNGIPPFPETQNYVKTVMQYYSDFSEK